MTVYYLCPVCCYDVDDDNEWIKEHPIAYCVIGSPYHKQCGYESHLEYCINAELCKLKNQGLTLKVLGFIKRLQGESGVHYSRITDIINSIIDIDLKGDDDTKDFLEHLTGKDFIIFDGMMAKITTEGEYLLLK